jgi:hypothetical protein
VEVVSAGADVNINSKFRSVLRLVRESLCGLHWKSMWQYEYRLLELEQTGEGMLIDQSVKRPAAGWTVRRLNPCVGEIFHTRYNGPGAHPSSYTIGSGSFAGVNW